MPEFRGHTGRSLGILYDRLLTRVAGKSMKSSREVTVEEVVEYWNTSNRNTKPSSLKRREEIVISIFLEKKALGAMLE